MAGRFKLVGAIALTDHSAEAAAVARFERDRTPKRLPFHSSRLGENDFQLSCAGTIYYLHLLPLRGGEIVRKCIFREKQGQNVLITAG